MDSRGRRSRGGYKLIKKAGRPSLILRWHDGERWRERATGCTRRRDAERIVDELIGETGQRSAGDWYDFQRDYLADLADSSAAYRASSATALRHLAAASNPDYVADVTARDLATMRANLRRAGRKVATIRSYLKTVRAALAWAQRHGYLATVPEIDLPRAPAEPMRGRPLTGEEFDRLLEAAGQVLPAEPAERLRELLRVLWSTGLRLGEALELSHDDPGGLLIGDLTARRPVLWIPAAHDKARRSRALPLTPDAVDCLASLPIRPGRALEVLGKSGRAVKADAAGKLISRVGKRSRIRVGTTGHPTAHDLRRSFACRWALRVPPVVLRELMRHKSLETTLAYYVGQDAERTGDAVYEAAGRGPGGVLGGGPVRANDPEPPKSRFPKS